MKKLLSALVLIAVLMTACFVGAMPTAAATNYDDFDIYDGILVEYLGPGGDVVIPSKDADGNPVTEIDGKAFYDNDDITSVVIPEGITKIGSEAFSFCDYLEKVSLPYSLEKCGISVFRRSPAISKITIPAQLKDVPQDFCSGCTSLTEVVISYGVETIGVYAFCDMKNLERIVFSSTVKEIFGYAIANNMSDKTEVVICNPMCELGYMNGYRTNDGGLTGKEYKSPFTSPQHKKTAWTFIVPAGSTVAQDIEGYDNPNFRVRTADKTYFDELPENQSDFGVQSAEDAQAEIEQEQEEEEGGNENNGNAATNNGASASFDLTKILIILGAAFGGLILLIVIIIVVVIVVKNNKKKKKAAAKAARRAAKKAAEEAPVDEAVVEEAPVDEVPTEDAE